MNTLYSRLSPAELERIAILQEEMSEVSQALCKIQRHGYVTTDHSTNQLYDNRFDLAKELGHLLNALELMVQNHDIDAKVVQQAWNEKKLSINAYLHHNHIPTPGDPDFGTPNVPEKFIIVRNATDQWSGHFQTDPKLGVDAMFSCHSTYLGKLAGIKDFYRTRQEADVDLFRLQQLTGDTIHAVCPVKI